ncbi:hypothetical protein D3227_28375 [Mesorhizobium waimense]|uniref:Uncharacterized protein n=1 Tax=Mesorhizobium waimense TaxID=1300307 RepID=A0A3A5KFQ9_9HYPH|nr:hypothetical protein D3227_28375 [Mesorhizobium waimense]
MVVIHFADRFRRVSGPRSRARTHNQWPTIAAVQTAAGEFDGKRLASYRDEPAEHAFDGVSVVVEDRREAVLPSPAAFGGMAAGFDQAAGRVRIITLVGLQYPGVWQTFQWLGSPSNQRPGRR